MTDAIAPERTPPAMVERLTQPIILEQFLAGLTARSDPADRSAVLKRASLLRGLGRWAEALALYRALLDRDPADRVAQAAVAIFDGASALPLADGPTPFVQIPNALMPTQQDRLWHTLRAETARLVPATVGAGYAAPREDPTIRIARRLHRSGEVADWFLPWLEEVIAREAVLPRLGLAPFAVGTRELQVTGHGDGGYFQIHRDTASNPAAPAWGRYLTFIYYFHQVPRLFTGGDLLLFDPPSAGQFDFTRIDPLHNSLIFFQSHHFHTVTRVQCPSDDLLQGRWTVNGWLHRAETP